MLRWAWSPVYLSCTALGFMASAGACGNSTRAGFAPDAGGTDASVRTDGGIFNPDGGIADSESTFGCSGDLRSIVDANGTVVATCPADQGCSAGKCIGACDAAAASRGSLGCDFWLSTPVTYDVEQNQKQPCFAMFVANTWPLPAALTVSRSGTTYDVTTFGHTPQPAVAPAMWPLITSQGVAVDDVAVLYLSSDPDATFVEDATIDLSCPSPTATGAATEIVGTGKSSAFHVTSSVPVSAYDIFPFGGANSHFPSAELLYPSSAWGTNYLILAAPEGTATPQRLKFGDIVAFQDGTSVTFQPTVDLPGGGGFPAVTQNTSTTFALNAGDYAHWETAPAALDLSGSVVFSTKPGSVTTGEEFLRLQPMPEPGGDATHTQIPPVQAVGNDYAVAPYATRRADLMEESIAYRIVGFVDGTTLTFDPPVSSAPGSVVHSQVADFQTTGPFRVQSQDKDHPFSIAQVMSTGNVVPAFRTDCATIAFQNYPEACGDEDFVPLVPPAQFLSSYVFFTDPTYSTTTLEVVRAAKRRQLSRRHHRLPGDARRLAAHRFRRPIRVHATGSRACAGGCGELRERQAPGVEPRAVRLGRLRPRHVFVVRISGRGQRRRAEHRDRDAGAVMRRRDQRHRGPGAIRRR